MWFLGGQTNKDVSKVVRDNTTATSRLSEVAVFAQQIRRYEKEYFVYVTNPERRQGYIKEWTGTFDKLDTALSVLAANKDDSIAKADVEQVLKWRAAAEFYGSEMKKIFASVDARATEVTQAQQAVAATPSASTKVAGTPAQVVTMFTPIEVNGMIGPGKDRFSAELIAGVAKLSKAKTEQLLNLPQVAAAGFDKLLFGAIGLALLGAALGVALIVTLPAAVQQPIAELTKVVDGISKGAVATAAKSVGVAEFTSLEQGLERLRQGQKLMLERMGRKFD